MRTLRENEYASLLILNIIKKNIREPGKNEGCLL